MWDWIADKWAKHGNTILTVAAATVAFVAVTAVTGGLGAPAAAALILGGAASGATGYVVGQKLAGRPIEAKQVVIQATIGAAVTVATAGLGRVATPLFSKLLGVGAQQAATEGARTGIRAIAAETAAHSLAGGATGGTVKVVENAVTGKKLTDGVLEAAAIGAAQGALARPTKALGDKIQTTTAALKARVAARVRPSSRSLASGTARQLDSALGEEPSTAPKGEELAPADEVAQGPSNATRTPSDVAPAEARGPPAAEPTQARKGIAQALDPETPLGVSPKPIDLTAGKAPQFGVVRMKPGHGPSVAIGNYESGGPTSHAALVAKAFPGADPADFRGFNFEDGKPIVYPRTSLGPNADPAAVQAAAEHGLGVNNPGQSAE